jgi:methionine-rich copper-binding protein CopC
MIPSSVVSIGYYAFDSCPALKDVYYGGTQDDWNNILIQSNNEALINANIQFNYVVEKKDNTLSAKGGKTAKVKYKKLRKKKQTVARGKMMTVSGAQGKVTYKIVKVNKKKSSFKINAATGAVTVKKKLKKGTYKLTVRVTAAGNDEYKPVTRTVSFKIKVK